MDGICDKLYLVITKVQQSDLKKLVIGSAADFSHASHFVIDLSSLKDTSDEVIDAIGAFKTMYDARVIVIADNEPQGSPLLGRLFDMGVFDVVTVPDETELRKCLTRGKSREEAAQYRIEKPDLTTNSQKEEKKRQPRAQAPPRTPPKTPRPATPVIQPPIVAAEPPVSAVREKITANREFKKHKQFVTVAVCATEPHMGATHHALLIAKFLSGVGYKPCYLEASERRKILNMARAYSVNANERKHLIQYEGVDMYFDFKLPEVIAQGYDFYVFDFGSFTETEAASFLTKDIKIIVGGSKAWEMPAYADVFGGIDGCRDVHFILNFTPTQEAQGIRGQMGGYPVHFSDYAPSPFAQDINTHIYKELFRDYITVVQTRAALPEQRGKRKFFDNWG